jgi:hypothetical protein
MLPRPLRDGKPLFFDHFRSESESDQPNNYASCTKRGNARSVEEMKALFLAANEGRSRAPGRHWAAGSAETNRVAIDVDLL